MITFPYFSLALRLFCLASGPSIPTLLSSCPELGSARATGKTKSNVRLRCNPP